MWCTKITSTKSELKFPFSQNPILICFRHLGNWTWYAVQDIVFSVNKLRVKFLCDKMPLDISVEHILNTATVTVKCIHNADMFTCCSLSMLGAQNRHWHCQIASLEKHQLNANALVNDFGPPKLIFFFFAVSAEYFWLLKLWCITNNRIWKNVGNGSFNFCTEIWIILDRTYIVLNWK